MSIDYEQLRDFIMAIAQTEITELTLKSGDFELTVRKEARVISPTSTQEKTEFVVPSVVAIPPKPVAAPETPPAPTPTDRKWVEITSPMVGTFYRAPAPGEPPFVEVNDRIRPSQTVCIIEAMKLMNEIEAEISGQVMEIAVENGQPVEYGQTLMWIKPD